jgi:predicted N-formylglutamate amidohydrolase
MLEVRNDLLAPRGAAEALAERLAPVLTEALASLDAAPGAAAAAE